MQIPELDFEIPPEAQRGSLSTVSSLTLSILFNFFPLLVAFLIGFGFVD